MATPSTNGGDGAAASDAAPGSTDAGPSGPAPLATYHADIRPVLEAECVGCHVAGGAGPFPLDSYAAVEPLGALVVSAVREGRMPPWPADPTCRPQRDARALSAELRARFEDWEKSGFVEGDPSSFAPLDRGSNVDLGDPSIVMAMAQQYVPDARLDDDYRCFVLEETFAEDTFVSAMDIWPGSAAQVHHAQIHQIPASSLAAARANDEASAGVGYQCFGGVSVANSQNMFSWRPGAETLAFERGDASFIPAGSGVVVQVHYNNQALQAGASPEADLTRIALWTLPANRPPERIVTRVQTLVYPLSILAGDAEVVAERSQSMRSVSAVGRGLFGTSSYLQGEIIGMTPHMHQLGTRISSEIVRADGSRECMVEIPEWNFEWQLDYLFAKQVDYAQGDSLTLRCEYDNSLMHQPVIQGQRLTPRDVGWGEGSLDEMCLNYVWLRFPRQEFLDAR